MEVFVFETQARFDSVKSLFARLAMFRKRRWLVSIFITTFALGIYLQFRVKEKDEYEHDLVMPLDVGAGSGRKPFEGNEAGIKRKSELRRNPVGKSSQVGGVNITNFNAEDFDAAWNEAVRLGSTEIDQVYNLTLVVERMSKVADPNQVLDKILATFGPGRSRCQLVSSLFMACDRVNDLESVFKRLEFPDELSAACSGLSKSLCMVKSPDLIDPSKYAFLGNRFDEVLQKSMVFYVSRFLSGAPEDLSIALSQAMATQRSAEGRLDLISKLIKVTPFDCWEYVVANKLPLSGSDQNALLAQMFARDAAAAMDQIASVKDGEKYFSPAFQKWLENDARKPIEWLEDHKQSLTPAQRERAMQGIAEYSGRQGDIETAWKWVQQISDPALHKVAEGQVWSMERDAVRKEVGQNPEATVQGMVSGESSRAGYWLEEAMATWLAKDPAKAQEWYQKNWNSIPAEKSQYVAAAFANQVLKQGDVTAASQWAALIQDPKTKQRIQAGINKAITKNQNQ